MGDPGETIPVRKRGQSTNKTGSQAAKTKKQTNKFRINNNNNSLNLHNKEDAHTPSQQVAMGSTTRNSLNKQEIN